MNKLTIVLLSISFGIGVLYYSSNKQKNITPQTDTTQEIQEISIENDLTITSLRKKYASLNPDTISIVETLPPGTNYKRFIASYLSEGNKIFALLTIPNGETPKDGWPVIIFNHGYIPPTEYRTTERYIAYTNAFSKAGYIVFRSDYRGHGSSEGTPGGSYGSNDYTIDVLNGLEAIKKYPGVDSNRIGMWGHSMGGHITLRAMVTAQDIKAGIIWAGVVGSYEDLLNNWRRRSTPSISPTPNSRNWRNALLLTYGSPQENPDFWNSISATSFLSDISGPIQLHHGTADSSVPYAFSTSLDERLKLVQKPVELFIYDGDDHNIANNLSLALSRSVEFFDKYVKNITQR